MLLRYCRLRVILPDKYDRRCHVCRRILAGRNRYRTDANHGFLTLCRSFFFALQGEKMTYIKKESTAAMSVMVVAQPALEQKENPMKYGFVLPVGDARTVADLAYDAEQAGWDGLFVAETVWGIDAWISLTAAAMRTERIRLGTDLTPLSRMRPWKLASETATLDHLSNGRVIV